MTPQLFIELVAASAAGAGTAATFMRYAPKARAAATADAQTATIEAQAARILALEGDVRDRDREIAQLIGKVDTLQGIVVALATGRGDIAP